MILLTNMEAHYSTFVHVPQIGSIVCTYMYRRLVVLCVHVSQVDNIVCTSTSGW